MPTYEVVIKKVPAPRVASIHDTIPAYSQQQQLWHELDAYLTQQRLQVTRPCFALYHDTEYRERAVDAEVCFPVGVAARSRGRVQVRELPPVERMASVVHTRPFNTLNQAYNALMQWIQANGYRICGTNREIYLRSTEPVRQDDPSYVTDIQFPVEQA